MKVVKILLAIIGALVVVFLVGSLFLPKTYTVSRSTHIQATDSVVYGNIADFNAFYTWNPWAKMEPNAKTTISGNIGQAGHLYEWQGDKMGSGQMKILKAHPFRMVDIELRFIKPFESLADTRFDLSPKEGGTEVVWTMTGENTNIMSKWMCLFIDDMVGKDFESGLRSLKEKSEGHL